MPLKVMRVQATRLSRRSGRRSPPAVTTIGQKSPQRNLVQHVEAPSPIGAEGAGLTPGAKPGLSEESLEFPDDGYPSSNPEHGIWLILLAELHIRVRSGPLAKSLILVIGLSARGSKSNQLADAIVEPPYYNKTKKRTRQQAKS